MQNSTHNSIPTVQQAPLPQTDFSTSLCSCLSDEETCWWGTWCCCLLSARTTESFGIGKSLVQSTVFISLVLLSFFFLIVEIPLISFILLLVGCFIYAVYRARVRQEIRTKLGISGSIFSDFINHYCCCCCAVCQEAREAKLKSKPHLDYCSGQDLGQLVDSYDQIDNEVENLPDGLFLVQFNKISITSKIIAVLIAVLACIAIIVLLSTNRASKVLVLLLIFIQPIALLYYFYWLKRRKYASLDYVIKIFTCGFFFATTQAIVLEQILEILLGLFVIIVVTLSTNSDPNQLHAQQGGSRDSTNLIDNIRNEQQNSFLNAWNSIRSMTVRPLNEAIFGPTDISLIANSVGLNEVNSNYSNGTSSVGDDTPLLGSSHALLTNPLLLVFVLLFTSYIIAGTVEEIVKHFTVRCCSFPVQLRDPHSVLVYMMAGALGFATAENIEYVFSAKKSEIPGTSLFVGELFILGIRLLMPIHVICSVLQSARFSKVLMGQSAMSLFHVLLSAIFLHGTFDFVLYFMKSVEDAYDLANNILYTVFEMVVPLLITICGIVWAMRSFNAVEESFRAGWQRFPTEETNL